MKIVKTHRFGLLQYGGGYIILLLGFNREEEGKLGITAEFYRGQGSRKEAETELQTIIKKYLEVSIERDYLKELPDHLITLDNLTENSVRLIKEGYGCATIPLMPKVKPPKNEATIIENKILTKLDRIIELLEDR